MLVFLSALILMHSHDICVYISVRPTSSYLTTPFEMKHDEEKIVELKRLK